MKLSEIREMFRNPPAPKVVKGVDYGIRDFSIVIKLDHFKQSLESFASAALGASDSVDAMAYAYKKATERDIVSSFRVRTETTSPPPPFKISAPDFLKSAMDV